MPFVKLKTNLASQKFGNDRPGGGSSNEPYQQFPTNGLQISNNSFNSVYFSNKYVDVANTSFIPRDFQELYEATRNSSDFPIRGGTLDFDFRTQTVTRFGKLDKERIQKFLKDKPRGTTFLLKQAGLQFSNPKIQVGKTIQGVTDFNLIENTRVFNNGVNLLAQVGVAGTGTHFVRHGLLPYNPLEKTYEKTVINQPTDSNRLVTLWKTKIESTNASGLSRETRAAVSELGLSYNPNVLFQYLGGPSSVYGIGSTTIRRYENTTLGTQVNSYSSRNYNKLRPDLNDNYNTGNPGKGLGDIAADKLNEAPLFYHNSKNPYATSPSADAQHKDIIKFVFECIDNDNPENNMSLFFRAFLSGITDNHQATINSFRYFGRGEEFYTYQGVSRAIGFSFKIAAQTEQEMQPLYNKLNYLISQVYPDYSRSGVMRAPLIRLTIGDYFYRVAGLLESINITIDDNVPWEINVDKKENIRQLPQLLSVQCSFKPIQDFLPRRAKYTSDFQYVNGQGELNDAVSGINVPYITEYKEQGGYIIDSLIYDITPNTINPPPKLPIRNSSSQTLADEEMNRAFLDNIQEQERLAAINYTNEIAEQQRLERLGLL